MASLRRNSILGLGGIAAAAMLLPAAALASHGKVGLWEMTTKVDMSGMQMPDTANLPPEIQARIKAMQAHMSGKGITARHCMSQAEVDQDKPPMREKDCKITNYKISGHTFTGDMTCSGKFHGTGHVKVVYDSDEHYVGHATMSGSAEGGQPMNTSSTFEGRWLSASCGALKPGETE